jgi:hypothetical protein
MENHTHKINLQKDRPIINLLGEVCWGFPIDNFEKKIGVKKEIAEQLLKRLIREEKTGVIETHLSDAEVEILKRAFKEVVNEMEKEEFHTRIGATLDMVREIAILK